MHKDGHRVPVLIGAAAISRNPLRWTSFVIDLTARQRAGRERAALLARSAPIAPRRTAHGSGWLS